MQTLDAITHTDAYTHARWLFAWLDLGAIPAFCPLAAGAVAGGGVSVSTCVIYFFFFTPLQSLFQSPMFSFFFFLLPSPPSCPTQRHLTSPTQRHLTTFPSPIHHHPPPTTLLPSQPPLPALCVVPPRPRKFSPSAKATSYTRTQALSLPADGCASPSPPSCPSP